MSVDNKRSGEHTARAIVLASIWLAAAAVSVVVLLTQQDFESAKEFVFYVLGGAALLTFLSSVLD